MPNEGSFSFWYFDHRLPVAAGSLLGDRQDGRRFRRARRQRGLRAESLLGIADRYGELSAPSREHAPTLKAALAARGRRRGHHRAGLAAYTTRSDDTTRSPLTACSNASTIDSHTGASPSAKSIIAGFFDINDLAGIRVEDMRTFRLTHRKVAQMIADGTLHGLRLDHIDGLYDPEQYCARLQRLIGAARGTVNAKPFYTVVEKILAPE